MAAGAEAGRVRPARAAAVQRGQEQAEKRRDRGRAATGARRSQLSHRRGQTTDAGHARLKDAGGVIIAATAAATRDDGRAHAEQRLINNNLL